LNEPLFAAMLPLYALSFASLATDLAEVRHEFCQRLAAAAVYLTTDP
jgi:hypothetical protein